MSDYYTLIAHLEHHDVKTWLRNGARREDANTIGRAIEHTSSRRLRHYLAIALAGEKTPSIVRSRERYSDWIIPARIKVP